MNFLHYFRGITRFTVESKKTMKLICAIKNEIPIREVTRCCENSIEFTVFCGYEKKVREAVCKNGGQVIKEKPWGLPILILRHKKRPGLYVTGILVFLMLMLSQLFVWKISVEGNENVKDSEIIKTLNEIGFKEGVYKKSVDIDSLVNNFLIHEKRISWIAVNFDGSVAHVEVREGRNPPIESKKKNVNLVATHDGIIMRADVLDGGCVVQKGDVVHKGQLLVSAFIDRNEKSTLRGARGSVWANTEREIWVRVPIEASEKEYTGEIKNVYYLDVLGKKLKIGSYNGKFQFCTVDKEKVEAVVSDDFYLPFELVKCSYKEYRPYSTTRTQEEALSSAREKALFMLEEISPTFTIASKEEKILVENNVLLYSCLYTGVENIAAALEFEME